jgi:hypothetical protein
VSVVTLNRPERLNASLVEAGFLIPVRPETGHAA